MSYVSMTSPGQSRGPHEHRNQTDHFCFLGYSSFRLYIWDNRPDSRTYRNKCRIDIGTDDFVQITIPPGVVHAYKNTGSADGLIFNSPDRLYAGQGRSEPPDEIRYEDREDTDFSMD